MSLEAASAGTVHVAGFDGFKSLDVIADLEHRPNPNTLARMRERSPDRVLHVVSRCQCRVLGMTDRTGGIPRSFMRDFISLYKSFPCLWNPKARDYNYRSSKANAYQILVEKYREVEPGASKETVQQRLSSLRNCRRKELKKVKTAKELGEMYTPQLWYYSLMSFIDDPEDQEVEEISQSKCEQEEPPHTFEDSSIAYAADSPSPSHDSSGLPDVELRNSKASKRSREEEEDEEDILKILKHKLRGAKPTRATSPKPITPPPTTTSIGRFHHLAAHWADKLAGLKGEQRIFAEKLINDTFYEAEFGRLGHGCRIVPFN